MTQSLRAGRAVTDDPEVQRKIIYELSRRLPSLDLNLSPAVMTQCAYDVPREITGVADPYKEQKRFQNDMALAMEDELRGLVAESDNPMDTALHISVAGNIIDLGTQDEKDINGSVRGALQEALHQRFAVDHSAAFMESLSNCSDLLFLLDNAGEIVFDKILIEELLEYTSVTAVVKAGPIINDVTMEDAEYVGLTDVCEVIDNGGAFIGSPIDLVPEHFLERMKAADIIIGKGHGNFETVDVFDGDVFLMLRAKCDVVAAQMGVTNGQVGMISTRVRQAEAEQ